MAEEFVNENMTTDIKKQNKERRKKDIIKNTIIVFLVIMLLLTFFSNTIMNYSLPQVSTEYVMSNSISVKVRGSGTVEASDPYELVANDTRVIKSIPVAVGDVVEAGDVLFELEDKESDELLAAREEVAGLELEYQTFVLTNGITVDNLEKIEGGKLESLTDMQQAVSTYKSKADNLTKSINSYQLQVAQLNAQIDALQYVDTSAESNAVTNAKSAVTSADINVSSTQASMNTAETLMNQKQAAYQAASDAKSKYDDAVEARKNAEIQVKKAKKIKEEDPTPENIADYKEAKNALEKASSAESLAKSELDRCGDASSAMSEYSGSLEAYNAAAVAYSVAVNGQSSANNTLSLAQEALANKEDVREEVKALNRQLSEINGKLAIAQLNQATATTNYTEAQTKCINELNLENQLRKLNIAKEKLEKLESEAVGATINAPVGGSITAINVTSGEKTSPDQTIMTIAPAGREKTLTISVTKEQASRVQVGAVAELQNGWYYDNLVITLVKIKEDKNNPGKGKLLVFNIDGEVETGDNLEISVGDRSTNYDLVVPVSAIKEDKNGKYVLSIESKSSPLGNRYIARRTDVEVIAQDDVHAAIKADIASYDYVITTTSKPVEPGNQVRLNDN